MSSEPPTPQPTENDAGPPRARRPWWRRWLRRLAITAVVARLVLAVGLEQLADFGAGFAGLSVSWRSHSLSLLGLSLHIEDLEVRARDVAVDEPLLRAQELIADLSMRQLLSGRLSVVDVGLSGARITVVRAADGTLRLPPAWLAPGDAPTEPPVAEPPQPLSFELPVRVASARLHDVRFELVDEATTPPTRQGGSLDVDVADVGLPDRNGALTVRVHAPAWFDDLSVQATVTARAERAELDFSLALRGVRPGRFELPDELSRSIDHANVVDLAVDGHFAAAVLPEAPMHPALEGNGALRLQLDGVERAHANVALGPSDVAATADGAIETPFSFEVHLHDAVEKLQVRDGRLHFDDADVRVAGTIEAQRLTLRRTHDLLAAAGVELVDQGVDLQAKFDVTASETLSLQLDDFTIGPDDRQRLSLPRVVVRGLGAVDGAMVLEELTIVGPELQLRSEADGTLALAGLRLLAQASPTPTATTPTATTAPPPVPSNAAAAQLPKLHIGKVDWSGAAVRFTDEATTPPSTLAVEAVHVHTEGMVLGDAGPPGTLTLTARVPDAIDELRFEAQLTPRTDGVAADARLRASGLGGTALAPWLERFGLGCDLGAGTFGFALSADIQQLADGFGCDARLADLRLVDGDEQWLKVRAVEGKGLRVTGDGLALGDWTVTEPFAAVRRDADGTLHLLGNRLLGASAAKPDGEPIEPLPRPDQLPDTSRPLLRHGELRVDGAVLSWLDAARGPTPRTFGLDASLGANDGTIEMLPARVALRIPGAVDRLGVDARLRLVPDDFAVTATVTVRGLRGAGLDDLLPPGMHCTLVDGALDLQVEANAAADQLAAALRGLKLADGAAELFAVDEALLKVPQLGADEVHVEEVTLRGVRSVAALTESALQVPGFALASAPPPPTGRSTAEQPTTKTDEAAVADAPRASPLQLPKLTIDAARVQLERFEVRDRRASEAPPLVLQAELTLDRPWIGDARAEQPEPMRWSLRADAAPLGAHVDLHVEASPLAPSPTLDAELNMTGFDTTRLTEVLPSLTTQLRGDARQLEVSAELHAQLQLRRRDVTRFDLGRPFGFEVHVGDVALRDAATERTFASVAAIDVVARSFDPRSGDLLLRSVDVDEPRFAASRDAEGFHAAGFVLLAGETEPAAPAPTAPATGGDATVDVAEFAVDRLRMFGVAAEFVDETTDPPTNLRLVDTDAELLRFSTAALHEARPFSFTVTARGGDIELPRRVVRSPVQGLLSAVGHLALGADGHETEQRPLLDQAVIKGQLELWPKAKGRVTATVDTLELAAFRGLAEQAGVELSDGTYDLRAVANLRGYDGIDIASRHVLTWLSLDEPADGPISTYLRLPAPLQTVLFLLRNGAGEQRLPIDLHVPADGISRGAILDLAIASLTRVIADAVAGAGSRVTQVITDPLFGSDEAAVVTSEATFRPGSPLPDEVPLAAITAAMADDPTLSIVLTHELGSADVDHAAELANPAPALVQATAGELRQQRDELELQRGPLAREVTALYHAAKYPDARQRHAELRALDTKLGELQMTLRRALDQLSAQSPRAANRRTRAAVESLAASRFDALEARLRAALPELDPSRIERRLGRPSPTEGLDSGGRVVMVTRRRLPDEKLDPRRPQPARDTPRTLDELGGAGEPGPTQLPGTSRRQP
ncbi:MAG: DUF748 domain-containing protein [Planctomycetes bacterium]|nr:DUF748 domain-containing protein [Planctomycetota bacterium]